MTGAAADPGPDGPAVAPPNGSVPPVTGGGAPSESEALSEADRAAAFATGRAPVDRAAALRAGSVPVPRKFVRWIIVAFAVLGLGGIVGEKLIGNAGVGALGATSVTTLAGTGAPVTGATSATAPATPTAPDAPAVDASPSAVIGLTRLAGHQAPVISLRDQGGAAWDLAGARGKVVVLTFFNSECDDICPVLAREIVQADQLLGARSRDVDFVVVNSDPLETSLAPTPPALTRTGLAARSNVSFLSGSLAQLDTVWKKYGVTVAVDNTDRVITHNDVMDFVGPTGKLELSATPFANENTLGIYSLQPAVVHTFARGVADSAAGLLKGV
jgi:cytochrome oxidase Cu insertion factor (SCO1/SenC/PrrC family)